MRLKPYGPRGVAMLFLAGLAFGRAILYLQVPPSPFFTPAVLLEWPIPVWVWGIFWLLGGLHTAFAAFTKKHALALAVLQTMTMLWAIVYIIAAWNRVGIDGLAGGLASIIQASVYVAIAGIVYCLSRMVNLSHKQLEVSADG